MTTHRLSYGVVGLTTIFAVALSKPTRTLTDDSTSPFRARVVGVYDGDTILIRPSGSTRWQAIRLFGIDAPEYDPPSVQRFGAAAYDYVVDRAGQEDVTIRPVSRDWYGRIIADVVLPDGKLLNTEVISAGLGWVYRRYTAEPRESQWLALEAAARSAKLGLWADDSPVAPWVWRQSH